MGEVWKTSMAQAATSNASTGPYDATSTTSVSTPAPATTSRGEQSFVKNQNNQPKPT